MRRAAVNLRRVSRRAGPFAVGVAVLVGLFGGSFASLVELGRLPAALLAVLILTVCLLGWRKIHYAATERDLGLAEEAELGALLLLATYVVAQPWGGVESPLYPLIYLVMAFVAGFLPARVAAGLLLFAIFIEFGLFIASGALPEGWPTLASHAIFLALFSVLSRLVFAWQVATGRATEKIALLQEQRKRAEAARLHRLRDIETEDFDEERWVQAALVEVEEAVSNALDVAASAMQTHTVAVFMLQEDGRTLRLTGHRSEAKDLLRRPFTSSEGLLAAAMQRRTPMRLCGAFKGVTWYEEPKDVRSVLIVPILDQRGQLVAREGDGLLRGLLVADRLEAVEFTERDEHIFSVTAREILRAVEIERVMSYISKAREEKAHFHRWTERFNSVSKVGQVIETALDVARDAVCTASEGMPPNLLALTTCSQDPKTGKRVHRVDGILSDGIRGIGDWAGVESADERSLVAQVVQHGTTLPERDVESMQRVEVFGDGHQLRGLGSLKIVPLRLGDEVLGTLVCASKRRGALGPDAVRLLEFVALQAAQSLSRAQLFERTERMAVTDGLTGLTNHRAFHARLDEEIARARRSQRPLSLIVCDIDHFKTVNDTYGHATGDLVLQGLARILGTNARSTDIAARIGGEEFALLLPDTNLSGGKEIAERLRKAVEAQPFSTDLGPLRCTISLGIASFPPCPADKQALFEAADRCLYQSKRSGRNRSFTVEEAERYEKEAAAASS